MRGGGAVLLDHERRAAQAAVNLNLTELHAATIPQCRVVSTKYVAVALQRWADATGKTPRLVE